jgi:hypothetical protein
MNELIRSGNKTCFDRSFRLVGAHRFDESSLVAESTPFSFDTDEPHEKNNFDKFS